ncbi:MAG: adenylosuccinate synthase [Flavobacteriales bacterium]
MKADVLLGLQWGDEGKGKIVDVLTPDYSVIARFQGGPNAGHTLEIGDIQHVLHTIPSGIFRDQVLNIVGNGVVIDPVIMRDEILELQKHGVDASRNLVISRKAHLILPTHRLLDAASEQAKGEDRIGSTLKGIGPTYMDRTGRNGIRIGDIFLKDFEERYEQLVDKHRRLLAQYDNVPNGPDSETEREWFDAVDLLRNMPVNDSEYEVNAKLQEGERLLAEGAQGALLDVDLGSYPYVTSSNTTTAGACTGLGIAPNRIGEVIGIFKAYCTRVGGGPFPTECHGEEGEALRRAGNEYGATTGRPRRCGWLDLPALKYSIMLNGATGLAMTKVDVLGGFDRIKLCTCYRIKGEGSNGEDLYSEKLPFHLEDERIEPVYEEFEGWGNLDEVHDWDDLPDELQRFIEHLSQALDRPINMISVGPSRERILMRESETVPGSVRN